MATIYNLGHREFSGLELEALDMFIAESTRGSSCKIGVRRVNDQQYLVLENDSRQLQLPLDGSEDLEVKALNKPSTPTKKAKKAEAPAA
jgi:hypothetical protein